MKNGFSVFNRGQNLQKSLINPDRIKQFLKGEAPADKTGLPKLPSALKLDFMDDKNLGEDMQWKLMLEYFKGNPAALLDALPSPTGSEEDKKALGDFKTGLTPQKAMTTKFGSKF